MPADTPLNNTDTSRAADSHATWPYFASRCHGAGHISSIFFYSAFYEPSFCISASVSDNRVFTHWPFAIDTLIRRYEEMPDYAITFAAAQLYFAAEGW